ncbi:50S ribosomal protein L25/general stress protein Ctc [Caldibacillus lycopersici]|uniref:Large ribosomal subunit protein bL25 n=1 Tax=Perspicuibacillus lycopersici TaxID=1325689 RepID=A0AAE3IW50_9BACI|nr:50S ribosomal protein L25/general stress protein Ctc [Perspicuibacillus lycopersici]MCU9615287.1 50S ribosomal protein L25/general stress protein Ctc [Perspicuibacillus lycopersici]
MEAMIQAKERTNFQRSVLNALRESGQIPAVVYGKNISSTPIVVQKSDFLKEIREVGRNGVLSVNLDGSKQKVVVRNYQDDPLTKEILHIDFLAVDANTEINTNVRINLTGEAEGVKDGGVLQQPMFELAITAKPDQIPEAIEVDVTNLKVGETVTVGEISSKYQFQIHHEADEVIASILPPKQEEEISTGEEQEPGIPDNLEGREEQEEV